MARVYCAGCNFEAKTKFLGGVPGLSCPNCGRESLGSYGDHFGCSSCSADWSMVPCPKCGTGILAKSVRGLF